MQYILEVAKRINNTLKYRYSQFVNAFVDLANHNPIYLTGFEDEQTRNEGRDSNAKSFYSLLVD